MLYQIKQIVKKNQAIALEQVDSQVDSEKPKADKATSHSQKDKDVEDEEISESLEKMSKTMKDGKKKKKNKKAGFNSIETELDKLLKSVEKSASGDEQLPEYY